VVAFFGGILSASFIFTNPASLDFLPPPALASTRLTSDETSTIKLFNRNTPSVVFITNLATRRDAFTLNNLEVPQGAGSGFVWDSNGHIITNFHVIRGASEVRVTLSGGSDYAASVVGVDEDRDVAVLRIDTSKKENKEKIKEDNSKDGVDVLHPLQLGTSSDLQVGQRVFAIGNPFGLDHTLTVGVISGVQR
jgi:S1-C subfamily serine protease